ncbi:2OG-Fe(II) oxygenase [Oceanospirillum sp.]|uniref:2OG-Fe(II) oxygenase n=1 Tax=Oceanospirillum sp. TaxID=2021254 RepID=UPI003A954C2D
MNPILNTVLQPDSCSASLVSQEDIDQICTDLYQSGWTVVENFLSAAFVDLMRQDLTTLDQQEKFHKAGIGRELDFVRREDIRSDRICWLDNINETQNLFMQMLDQLMTAVNRRLFLGMNHYEAMYAIYEPGQFYKKHVDSFKGQRNRIMTLVFYLNPDWTQEKGGELLLYPEVSESGVENNEPIITLPPKAGTVAAFLSEDFPHEVLTTHDIRYSIAVWFRIREGEIPL